jgi:hypothetical protein
VIKLKKWTNRRRLDGGYYPRCQGIDGNKQCNYSTYANDLCWAHYTAKAPQSSADRSEK